nr:MAG TPA: hypothetical protein [Caudoviricetes sp.]
MVGGGLFFVAFDSVSCYTGAYYFAFIRISNERLDAR